MVGPSFGKVVGKSSSSAGVVGSVYKGLSPEVSGDKYALGNANEKSRTSQPNVTDSKSSDSSTTAESRLQTKSKSKRKSSEKKDTKKRSSRSIEREERRAERRRRKEAREAARREENSKKPVEVLEKSKPTEEDRLIARFLGLNNPIPTKLYLVGIKIATKNANFASVKEALEKIFGVNRKQYTALNYD
ncbi:hypothetical protein BDAP_000186 [Binucleata daphniae]